MDYMEKKEKYRYELKYICSDIQITELEQRLSYLLTLDPHVRGKGYYTIRSLYFDDYYQQGYWDKENGVDKREKFRIRAYDANMEFLKLEIKRKQNNKTLKKSYAVTKKQYEDIISGNTAGLWEVKDAVLNQLLLQMQTRMLHPVIIVEYDRIPYICREGNVRVTLDKNIRSGKETDRFGDAQINTRSIMPRGSHLLEVKFDEFLPDYIYQTLNLENMTQTAFSKYYLCRKYS